MAHHSHGGLYFQRIADDGAVTIEKRVITVDGKDTYSTSPMAVVESWTLTKDEWASVVAAVSAKSDDSKAYYGARNIHDGHFGAFA